MKLFVQHLPDLGVSAANIKVAFELMKGTAADKDLQKIYIEWPGLNENAQEFKLAIENYNSPNAVKKYLVSVRKSNVKELTAEQTKALVAIVKPKCPAGHVNITHWTSSSYNCGIKRSGGMCLGKTDTKYAFLCGASNCWDSNKAFCNSCIFWNS